MKKEVLFVALDVDDNAFHGYFLNRSGERRGAFRCKPSIGALMPHLKNLQQEGFELRVCYEASHLGFSLLRDLRKLGFHCEVIAPSLIPSYAGLQKKTDRIDAQKLAEFYANGLLTAVYVPTEEEEAARSLTRARDRVIEQIRSLKGQINGLCRVHGLHYLARTNRKYSNYWTHRHRLWLDSAVKGISDPILKLNFSLLLLNLHQLEEIVSRYDAEIQRIAESELYRERVNALRSYRGIDTLAALSIVLELGDIRRFDHPGRLCSYAGIDVREYSSGGKERKFSITKMGNVYLRYRVIEACQFVFRPPKAGKPLQARRQGVDPKLIQIADRCMLRLHKKSTHLIHRGKHRNTIKVACAREMLCFIWESLQSIAAKPALAIG